MSSHSTVRGKIDEALMGRMAINQSMQGKTESGNLITFLMQQGVGEATDVLLIDSSNKERLCGNVPDVERMFRFLAQSNLATLQQRLVLSLQNTAEARYEAFTRLHPHLEERIPGYSVASYLGISPEFFSKLRNRPGRRRPS
jgi:hypothetical protein